MNYCFPICHAVGNEFLCYIRLKSTTLFAVAFNKTENFNQKLQKKHYNVIQ